MRCLLYLVSWKQYPTRLGKLLRSSCYRRKLNLGYSYIPLSVVCGFPCLQTLARDHGAEWATSLLDPLDNHGASWSQVKIREREFLHFMDNIPTIAYDGTLQNSCLLSLIRTSQITDGNPGWAQLLRLQAVILVLWPIISSIFTSLQTLGPLPIVWLVSIMAAKIIPYIKSQPLAHSQQEHEALILTMQRN